MSFSPVAQKKHDGKSGIPSVLHSNYFHDSKLAKIVSPRIRKMTSTQK